MRILIISDIHLKTKVFDRARSILSDGLADKAIQMGDMVDDYGEQSNIKLYNRTLDAAVSFQQLFPDTRWVVGNHDFGYWYPSCGVKETGHSKVAEIDTLLGLKSLAENGGEQKVLHIVNGVIFTHAGLTQRWVDRRKETLGIDADHTLSEKELLSLVNEASKEELWQEDSPIWVRPQVTPYEMYPAKLQVVGHTPVKKPYEVNKVLSTDVFSTYQNGAPYGNQRLVILDTISGKWKTIK